MSKLLTSDQYTRIKAWTQDLAPAPPPPNLPDSTNSQTAVSKRRTRAPLTSTSANIRKRKRDHLDEVDNKAPQTLAPETLDPAPTNTKGQKRGFANRRSRTTPAQPRTTVATRSVVPSKRRKSTMADKNVKEPAGLNDRRFPTRNRKPTAKAREGFEAGQRSWEETEGQSAQSRPPPALQAPPLIPQPRTPGAKSYGDPTRLNIAPRLAPSDHASLSDADDRSRPFPSPAKGVGSPSKASTSPTKKSRERTMTQPKADRSLTAMDLRTCTPSIVIMTVRDVLKLSQYSGKLPRLVDSLRLMLQTPAAFIPRNLMAGYTQEFNTPNKTQRVIREHDYQDAFANNPGYANMLKNVAQRVLKDAKFNDRVKAHERQWSSTTITFLINALMTNYQDYTQFLNLESCAILPVELRPLRKNGAPIYAADAESNTASQATDESTVDSKTSKLIDLAVGLTFPDDEQFVIDEWLDPFHDGKKSLNQTLSYPRYVPLFLDIELKKSESDREPEVQLGIWQAAGFTKRSIHGWNEDLMPMLGICINGHLWKHYITFPTGPERDARVIMMDAGSIGHTRDIFGVWEIMYKLDLILQWGTTEYREWFNRMVIDRARVENKRRRNISALD